MTSFIIANITNRGTRQKRTMEERREKTKLAKSNKNVAGFFVNDISTTMIGCIKNTTGPFIFAY
jgi:hypothetical protein